MQPVALFNAMQLAKAEVGFCKPLLGFCRRVSMGANAPHPINRKPLNIRKEAPMLLELYEARAIYDERLREAALERRARLVRKHQAQFVEMRGHNPGGTHLLKAQLRVGVEVSPPGDELGLEFLGFGCDVFLNCCHGLLPLAIGSSNDWAALRF